MKEKISSAKNIIASAINNHRKIAIACSFGKDSIVLVHLALKIDPRIPIFTVMTPFKPRETFLYKDYMTRLWNLNLKEYFQQDDIGAKKQKLWLNDPDKCCQYFKVCPTKIAVRHLDAWISGLRKSEGMTRIKFKTIEKRGNIAKINPIIDWSELDIWRYIAFNNIPVHPWYTKGYRSLGCSPCTHKAKGNKPERAGRWKGTKKCGGECGIHTQNLK
jgi:phosphoadenosine phosphosulfate reductase